MSQVRRPPVRAACLMVGSRRDGITCIPLWPPGTLALRTPQGLSPTATVAVGKGTLLVPAAYGQSPITGPTLKGSHRSAPPVAERLLKARSTVGSTPGYTHWLLMLLPSGEHGTVKLRYASFGFPGFPSGLSQSPEGVRLQRLLEIC